MKLDRIVVVTGAAGGMGALLFASAPMQPVD
jgi:NAD(P)-dependent dehydrogenase (short-subunit alcohol dehydrogenase family)